MKRLTVLSILVFNLLPLFGVFYLNWDALNMLFLYWSESLIIGFFALLRMIMASNAAPLPASYLEKYPNYKDTPGKRLAIKIFLVPFFCFHFGTFMAVHFAFISAFTLIANFNAAPTPDFSSLNMLDAPGTLFSGWLSHLTSSGSLLATTIPFLSLFAYHLFNFVFYYLRSKAYLSASPISEMVAPYPRIILTQIVLIATGAAVIFFAGKIPQLITAGILVFFKTALDLLAFQRWQADNQKALI